MAVRLIVVEVLVYAIGVVIGFVNITPIPELPRYGGYQTGCDCFLVLFVLLIQTAFTTLIAYV